MEHRNHSFSDGVTRVATRLVVHRHHTYSHGFCLSWDFGDGTAVGAEGECSRQVFYRARDAVAFGLRQYGERAVMARGW